ncbi:MAG: TRAP transporter large permease subunit [Clostridium sp.]
MLLQNKEMRIEIRQVFKRFLVSFKDAMGADHAVIILGGIYAGIFTPTESAVVTVVYGLIVLAVYREISSRRRSGRSLRIQQKELQT